MSGTRPR